MELKSVAQCATNLNFQPHKSWPSALPAISWRGERVAGFDRVEGWAIENNQTSWVELFVACHPQLALAELARLSERLQATWPELWQEYREPLFRAYGYRYQERLEQTLTAIRQTPKVFHDLIDEKALAPRDLAPLLAAPDLRTLSPFFEALAVIPGSKSEVTRALELVIELYLMGRPLNDLLPTQNAMSEYVRQLERWRKPNSAARDEQWRQDVEQWPWPAQVQGQWQRFGDQSGLEVKIRALSPEDFQKKLEKLVSIGNNWSCKS